MLNAVRFRRFGWVLGLLFALGEMLPAGAAKAVSTTAPRQPASRTYEETAASLGAKFWGDRFGTDRRNQITLRLDRTRVTLRIFVPAGVPSAQASTRLQELADRMGWDDAQLHQWVESGTQVFILSRRTAQEVKTAGWMRSQVSLNTPLLQEWIRSFNTDPIVVAVRASSPDLTGSSAPAEFRGTFAGEAFLFAAAPSAAPLVIQFQLPVRLAAAYFAALLLWMLFPPAAAFVLRRHFSGTARLAPRELETRFPRWRGLLTWVSGGGMLFTLTALGRDRLEFIVPALGSNLGAFVLVPLIFWSGASADWAWSRGKERLTPASPWERWANVAGFIAMLVVGPGAGLVFVALSRSGGSATWPQISWIIGGTLLLLLAIWMLATVVPIFVKLRRQTGSRAPAIDRDPENLSRLLAEATARAAAQALVPTPPLPAALDPRLAAQVRRFAEASRGLESDQQAALEVAAQLQLDRDSPASVFSLLLPLSAVLVLGGLVLIGMQLANPAGMITLAVAGGSLALGIFLFVRLPQRRLEKAEQEADLLVARAMDDPQRLVEALRRMEEAAAALEPGQELPLSSTFAWRRRNLERVLTVIILCLGLGSAGPGQAAPPEPSPDPPDLVIYQEAAEAVGAEFWGDPSLPAETAHVVLRVRASRTSLTLVVPGPLPEARLSAWLEETARELGWADADLQFHAGEDRSFLGLRAPTGSRTRAAGLGRRLELDLPRLAKQVKTLTPVPVTLAVRSDSPDLDLQVTPAAGKVIRGDYDGETYLFYTPAAVPTTPLLLEYRLPARWLTAVTATLLLWVLLPLGAAHTLRHHLARAMGDRPAELARTYATRASFIRLVAVAGSYGTLWLLGMGRLDFLYPGLGVLWPVLLVIPVWSIAALTCRAVRPPVPEAQMLGRRQDAGLMVLRHLALLAIGPGSVLLFLFAPSWRSGVFNRGIWLSGLALTTFSVYVLVNVGLQSYRAARLPIPPELPEIDGSPESIRNALRETTEFLTVNPRHVISLAKELKGTAIEQRFLRLQEKVLEMDPDQRSALRVAQAVLLRDARVKSPRANHAVLLSFVILAAGGFALMTGQHTAGSAIAVGLGSIGAARLLQRLVRRKLLRPVYAAQWDADLRVAREMEQPERLLAALRTLEEFAAHDPVLSDPRMRVEEFNHRRDHLETALLGEPVAPNPKTLPDSAPNTVKEDAP